MRTSYVIKSYLTSASTVTSEASGSASRRRAKLQSAKCTQCTALSSELYCILYCSVSCIVVFGSSVDRVNG